MSSQREPPAAHSLLPRPRSVVGGGSPPLVFGIWRVSRRPPVDIRLIEALLGAPIQQIEEGNLEFRRDPLQPDEAYALEVGRDSLGAPRAVVSASSADGFVWGLQTLRQLAPGPGSAAIPPLFIEDVPRFSWRGLLLDSARHFQPVEQLRRIVDQISSIKLNRLHWHLTDDQGWRVEIRTRPKLASVGGWRGGADGPPYGGFYRQEEIRDLVAYARLRGVTLVPEIDLPGHTRAALAAYPHLSCTGSPGPVETTWGIFEDVLCLGQDEALDFAREVLDEIATLFPSEDIHVGGDECPVTRWAACARCQARIRSEGLADERELQGWFLERLGEHLLRRGRRLIAWDEALDGRLPPGASIQAWRSMDAARVALTRGHRAIVSPTTHCYLDYAHIDTQRVYEFEPIPDGLLGGLDRGIRGGECNLWTERVPAERVEERLFPRLFAHAERLWSASEYREFPDLQRRIEVLAPLLGVPARATPWR